MGVTAIMKINMLVDWSLGVKNIAIARRTKEINPPANLRMNPVPSNKLCFPGSLTNSLTIMESNPKADRAVKMPAKLSAYEYKPKLAGPR